MISLCGEVRIRFLRRQKRRKDGILRFSPAGNSAGVLREDFRKRDESRRCSSQNSNSFQLSLIFIKKYRFLRKSFIYSYI